jgi:uncharacterized protein (DUF1501 family)
MSFTRREFLKTCGRGMGAATMMTALSYAGRENAYAAQAGDYKALVCLFLEGGIDSWNAVVPIDQPAYNTYVTNRGAMALSQGSLLPVTVPDAGNFGFHPSLTGIRSLWQQGKVALVCNVGNLIEPATPAQVLANPRLAPSGLFDHFQQQVYSQNLVNENTRGWGNSMGSNFPTFNTAPLIPMLMSMVNNTPWLKGPAQTITLQPNLNLGITGLPPTGPLPTRFDALKQVTSLAETSTLVNTFNGRVSRAIDDSRVVGSVFTDQPFTTVFPNTTIGQQLRQIALAIGARNALGHERRQLFYAQVGGNAYDTHGEQLVTMTRLLTELDAAVSAFYAALVELGVENQVTTFTFSEFGRTISANSTGTDHGWGNHYFVIGGSVLGGRFYGTYPPVRVGLPEFDFPLFSVTGNYRGAFIPVFSMDQYGNTLAQWFGLSDAAANDVFPNLDRFEPRTLGFLSQ